MPSEPTSVKMPGKDDSWVTFSVSPSRSPHGEYVFVELEAKPPHGRATAHFQLSRADAFDLAAQLSHAGKWLRWEAT
jgi:hypothetical protein